MQSLISQLQQIRTSVIVFDPKCAEGSGETVTYPSDAWRMLAGLCRDQLS